MPFVTHQRRNIGAAVLVLSAFALPACGGCEADNVNQLTADIEVSPTAVDFGSVPVGLTAMADVTVTNAGQAELRVSEMAVSGPMVFRAVDSTATVRPGESVAMRLEFTPSAEGVASATLVIVSNASTNPRVPVELTGLGTPPSVCSDCNTPPPGYCATTHTLITYSQNGTCVDNSCRYDAASMVCSGACSPAALMCIAVDDDGGMTPVDAGATDAAVADAAGAAPDAAVVVPDASVPDSSVPDAGVPSDACPAASAALTTVTAACPGVTDLLLAGVYAVRVPSACAQVQVDAWGAGGGGGEAVPTGAGMEGAQGGGGAFAGKNVSVADGEMLLITVGQGGAAGGCARPAPGGFPGGGRGGMGWSLGEGGGGGGGGGASTVERGSELLALAAGGGGGGGHGWGTGFVAGAGGGGGGADGANGADPVNARLPTCQNAVATGGGGGMVSQGGAGGTGLLAGTPGIMRQGGDGADVTGDGTDPGAGGGGGAGLFGGGGGGATTECNATAAGGGGGSSVGDMLVSANGSAPGNPTGVEQNGLGGTGGLGSATTRSGSAGHAGRVTLTFSP